ILDYQEISAWKDILTLAWRARFPHIAAARYCGSVREAAALPGRFLPELGRFGSPKRPFFFSAHLLSRGFVARAHVLTHTPRDAPAHVSKSAADRSVTLRRGGDYGRREGRDRWP